MEIIAREEELAQVSRFLDAVSEGPTVLFIEGEAGIGKTTVWQAGVDAARGRGYRLLTARPSESEAKFSFTSLADLSERVIEEALPSLPAVQRRALEVAVLRSDASGLPAEQQAVSMAFLGVLRHLAGKGPVVVAIDDLQWMDSPTAKVLEFCQRRLETEPVGLLASIRMPAEPTVYLGVDRNFPKDGVDRTRIGPLSFGAIQRIVRQAVGIDLSRAAMRRLYETSGGNPFFATELGLALSVSGKEVAPGAALPIPSTLQALVRERLARLPASSKTCLTFASALSTPTVRVVERAAGHGRAAVGLARAVEAGVLAREADRIRFAHPLLASFLYSDLTPGQRRKTHARLAELVTELEERARHMALASVEPDEAVASVLEGAGENAFRRGALSSAAELMEDSYRLTPGELAEPRRRRGLRALDIYEVSGRHAPALQLCHDLLAHWPEDLPRGRIFMELADVVEGNDAPAAVGYHQRALEEAGGDPMLQAAIHIRISHVMAWIGTSSEAERHARAALRLAEEASIVPLIASSLSRVAFDVAIQGGGLSADLMERFDATGWTDPIWGYTVVRDTFPTVLTWADRLDDARARLLRLRPIYEVSGSELSIFDVVTRLSYVESLSGKYREAAALAEQADDLLEPDDGWRFRSLSPWALAEAHLGMVEAARDKAERAVELGTRSRGPGSMSTLSGLATLGFLELSVGNPAAAHRHLARATEYARALGIGEPGAIRFVPDEIEVLVSLGELDDATLLLEWWEERSHTLDRAYGLAAGARCRALLAASLGNLPSALASLEEAIVHHERIADQPFELGRTLLVCGQVQRRARRRGAAKESLQRALDIFEALSSPLWAAKANAELRRVGIRASAPLDLTPTEERVAELAAAGRTNREVAAALFLSPKTVEANLARVYRKLGIASRAELGSSMAGRRRRSGA